MADELTRWWLSKPFVMRYLLSPFIVPVIASLVFPSLHVVALVTLMGLVIAKTQGFLLSQSTWIYIAVLATMPYWIWSVFAPFMLLRIDGTIGASDSESGGFRRWR